MGRRRVAGGTPPVERVSPWLARLKYLPAAAIAVFAIGLVIIVLAVH
jgi:hypothetical protein